MGRYLREVVAVLRIQPLKVLIIWLVRSGAVHAPTSHVLLGRHHVGRRRDHEPEVRLCELAGVATAAELGGRRLEAGRVQIQMFVVLGTQ